MRYTFQPGPLMIEAVCPDSGDERRVEADITAAGVVSWHCPVCDDEHEQQWGEDEVIGR